MSDEQKTPEVLLQERTQQLISVEIGSLVLQLSRLRAEREALTDLVESLKAALAGAQRSGTQDGARGADGPEKVVSIHG